MKDIISGLIAIALLIAFVAFAISLAKHSDETMKATNENVLPWIPNR